MEDSLAVVEVEHAGLGGTAWQNDIAGRSRSGNVRALFEPNETGNSEPSTIRLKIGLTLLPPLLDAGLIRHVAKGASYGNYEDLQAAHHSNCNLAKSSQ